MSTTTLTSLSLSKSEPKELCSMCGQQPFDLICTCGDKFDFGCIHQHVEVIGIEFQEQFQQASDKLGQIKDLQQTQNGDTNGVRILIEDWKRKRIQDINDIAEEALNKIQRSDDLYSSVELFEQTYKQLSDELHRIVHDNLNKVLALNQEIRDKIEDFQNASSSVLNDDSSLDAALQAKLNPSTITLNNYESIRNETERPAERRLETERPTERRFETERPFGRKLETERPTERKSEIEPTINRRVEIERPVERRTEIERPTEHRYEPERPTERRVETERPTERRYEPERSIENEPKLTLRTPPKTELPTEKNNRSEPPAADLTNTNKPNDTANEGTNHDEFDAGETRHIQRGNPILLPTNNDKYAATVCCHDNQLIYNDFDRATRENRLIFMPDINDPRSKMFLEWKQPDVTINSEDDEWVQDIIYSDKLSSYLLLNRTRLRLFKDDRDELDEFHTFNDRTMKRLSCSDKYIYLTSTHGSAPYNGDEIILLNYDKEEQVRKTFRDIIPSRLNRGASASVGEISDIGVGSNEHVIIGYRFERRHEVGVCLFKVTNDGKEWSCVKQLLLNECWHSDLSYTPRIDWCDKLNVFILIEYMTGHLIMIDQDGQIEGECRFMHAENRRESPINLTISTNNWLCVRYETSINIHKLN